jgi:redox-sensitive bicupin YhaK (pirin superfamily)
MNRTVVAAAPREKGRAIVSRTRGRRRGPATRLISPSDLGELLKPFVFLDLFEYEGPPFDGGLHPHSGIATLTHVTDGSVRYVDPTGATGRLAAGGVEWMQAGRGMWHGGGLDHGGLTRGFQLWIALPPALELGPASSVYQPPSDVPQEGPARVLLGSFGVARNPITPPSAINYLAVRLGAGERWRYEPPADHTVLWAAIGSGVLSVPGGLIQGEMAAFEPSNEPVDFEARTDVEFMLGSAAPHKHDLELGYYSVHTSPAALREAEAHIAAIKEDLVRDGRL